MAKLVFKELSYKIVGAIYETYNNLGYGHREKTYQRALTEELKNNNISLIFWLKIKLF